MLLAADGKDERFLPSVYPGRPSSISVALHGCVVDVSIDVGLSGVGNNSKIV